MPTRKSTERKAQPATLWRFRASMSSALTVMDAGSREENASIQNHTASLLIHQK
jgi:hypothetical protein